MSRILFGDMDMEYGYAITKAISNLHKEFEITTINLMTVNIEDTINQISWNNFDLVLIGGCTEALIKEILQNPLNHNKLVILTEQRTESLKKQSENPDNKAWSLYKYSSVSELISDLNYIIGNITGIKSFVRKSFATNIIGFYSIGGGVGKSVISIGTARELSRYHDKKVLYLSFDEIPATELFIRNNSNNKNMSDYLYYLFEKKDEILCSRLSAFVSIDEFGVETICPSNGRNDLSYLSSSELIYLIKILSDCCRYDYLIFDLDSDLSEETLLLMSQCLKIVLIQSNSLVSKFKNHKLITYLNNMNSFQFPDDFICVLNKVNSLGPELWAEENENTGLTKLIKIYIENDEISFRSMRDHLEININHAFGVGMKQIADEIISAENRKKQHSNSVN